MKNFLKKILAGFVVLICSASSYAASSQATGEVNFSAEEIIKFMQNHLNIIKLIFIYKV